MTQSMFARKHQQQFVKLYSVQYSLHRRACQLSNESCPIRCPANDSGGLLPVTGRPGQNCAAQVLYLHVSLAGSFLASTPVLRENTASHRTQRPQMR